MSKSSVNWDNILRCSNARRVLYKNYDEYDTIRMALHIHASRAYRKLPSDSNDSQQEPLLRFPQLLGNLWKKMWKT
jgi:hypothetical protein